MLLSHRSSPTASRPFLFLGPLLLGLIGLSLCQSGLLAQPVPVPRGAQPEVAGADGGLQRYLVLFDEAPVVEVLRGTPVAVAAAAGVVAEGAAVSRPTPAAARRAALATPAGRAVGRGVERRIEARLSRLSAAVGRPLPSSGRLRALRAGAVVEMSPVEAAVARSLPGVRAVVADRLLPLTTDAGPRWIGADGVWDHRPRKLASRGEGIVIGVIDSGIDPDHPSFSGSPDDGDAYAAPESGFVGVCDPSEASYDPTFPCSGKLIGAWDFMDDACPAAPGCDESDGARDTQDTHGTHVASTAAGNELEISEIATISGVAPRASVISYDACYRHQATFIGTCSSIAILQAIDQAILDGVDVLNLSLQGGFSPWAGSDSQLLLDAVEAGVFVAASAGNDGPGAGSVAFRAPWIATVAASTHDRVRYRADLDLDGGDTPPPTGLFGGGMSPGYGPASLSTAADFDDVNPDDDLFGGFGLRDEEFCAEDFPPGTWSGEIVLCRHGIVPVQLKAQAAMRGGAGAVVVYSTAGFLTDITLGYPTPIPLVWLDKSQSDQLLAWTGSGAGHTALLGAAVRVDDPLHGDRLADFSSRGPNPVIDVIKPDLAAPGGSGDQAILAAATPASQPGFEGVRVAYQAGTSMASPHVAGAAALVLDVHPDWSPSAVKSALMLTAVSDLRLEDGFTPAGSRDAGAGRIDVEAAVGSALVLDESADDYRDANPLAGGDPATVNVASMMSADCQGVCSWQRTFEGTRNGTTHWRVETFAAPGLEISASPSTFRLAKGASRTVTFTARIDDPAAVGEWLEGSVELSTNRGAPSARLPVLVFASAHDD